MLNGEDVEPCVTCCINYDKKHYDCNRTGWKQWIEYQHRWSKNLPASVFDDKSNQLAANMLYYLEGLYARS